MVPKPHIAAPLSILALLAAAMMPCACKRDLDSQLDGASPTQANAAAPSANANKVADAGGGLGGNPAAAGAISGTSQALQVKNPTVYDCRILDYGLYWYGPGNAAEKFAPGARLSYFDNAKPTVIYVHGWQPSSTAQQKRESFMFTDPATQAPVALADAWIKAGWNVGIYYWQQFADEDDVAVAEGKIWSQLTNAPIPWRQCDGSSSVEGAPTVGMGQLFYQTYTAAMKDYTGSNVRIVGHSLGNEMAVALAQQASQAVDNGALKANLRPTRVALLDPFWAAPKSGQISAATAVNTIIQTTAARGVSYEMYKSSDVLALGSLIGQGDANAALTTLIGESRMKLDYIKDTGGLLQVETDRHVVAALLYFLSFATKPPIGCNPTCKSLARSASSTDQDIMTMMRNAVIWQQTAGTATPSLLDDQYTKQ